MPPKHQIYTDRTEFVRSLFNDSTTANILLRVDNFHIYAHTTILYCTSGYFKKIFKILARKAKEKRNGYLFHDYSCKKEIAITKLHEYKGQENVELSYDSIDFQNFIAFIYGYPIETKDQDQLFVLAYLGSKHKFDVPELVDFCDGVLYEAWNNRRWHVILRACKWLGLKKLRCQVLKYVYSRGELMFQSHVKKDLNEQDWQIISLINDGKNPHLNIDKILDGTYKDEFIEENLDDPNMETESEDNCNVNELNNDDMMIVDEDESNESIEVSIADCEKTAANDGHKHVHWGQSETVLI